LGGLLSLVLSAADPRRPVASRALPDWAAWLLSSELHLWVLYLWASACLDVGTLLALLGGGTTEPGFSNPLLAARSLREAWGRRWNRPVHAMLKRTVYAPARRAGLGGAAASLLSFAASGLLHEYNFATHNFAAYRPGSATAFFLLMGLLMLGEAALQDWVGRRGAWRLQRLYAAMPSPLVAAGLRLAVLPAFEPLFMRSWIESGMLRAVGALVPHVTCDGDQFSL